jgi:hypothetical protein
MKDFWEENGSIADLTGIKGFAADFLTDTTVSFGLPEGGDRFALLSEDFEVLDLNLLDFLVAENSRSPSGFLIKGDSIHPQMVQYSASLGVETRLVDDDGRFLYSMEIRRTIWSLRAKLGSRSLSLIEISNATHLYPFVTDLFSISLAVGAYPSWNSSAAWESECALYHSVLTSYGPVFKEVISDNRYSANLDSLVQIERNVTTPDTFYEMSLFCQTTGQKSCFLNVLLGYNGSDVDSVDLQVSVKLMNSPFVSCFHISSNAECSVGSEYVVIGMKKAFVRTVVLKFYTAESTPTNDWVKENATLLIIVSVSAVAIIVLIIIGSWFLFFRRRVAGQDLDRVVGNEKRMRKLKKKGWEQY